MRLPIPKRSGLEEPEFAIGHLRGMEVAMLNHAMPATTGFNLPLHDQVIGRYDNPTFQVN
jgi:hypothetical protein